MASLAQTSLTEEERRVVERLVDVLPERLGGALEAVWLYGSRARGEPPGPESDVDLLVVADGGARRSRAVVDAVFDVAGEQGADPTAFSAQVVDPAWVSGRRAIDSFFMREVDRDKLVLLGSA